MKNRIKFITFILSLLTLFGCANSPILSSNEYSGQNSEISSTDVISSSDSEASGNTQSDDESGEQFLKAPAGKEGFVFNSDTFRFTIKDEMVDIQGMFDPHTPPSFDFEKYMEFLEKNNYIFAKVRIAGESFQTLSDIETDDGHYLTSVYTPVLIEEVVDSCGNGPVINKGDIVYTRETYFIVTDELIHVIEEELNEDKENFNHTGTYGYREKTIEYYKEHTNDNSLVLNRAYPMETGKSYLIAIHNEKIENPFGIDMLGNAGYALNLGDSAPDSYPYYDYFLYYYSEYAIFWRGCKELYGSYFTTPAPAPENSYSWLVQPTYDYDDVRLAASNVCVFPNVNTNRDYDSTWSEGNNNADVMQGSVIIHPIIFEKDSKLSLADFSTGNMYTGFDYRDIAVSCQHTLLMDNMNNGGMSALDEKLNIVGALQDASGVSPLITVYCNEDGKFYETQHGLYRDFVETTAPENGYVALIENKNVNADSLKYGYYHNGNPSIRYEFDDNCGSEHSYEGYMNSDYSETYPNLCNKKQNNVGFPYGKHYNLASLYSNIA